jgi:very-short-patch-repair endonuclease
MVMTVQDYIDKYGNDRGVEKFEATQRRLAIRAQTYATHPYTRLTKEWLVWRYPLDGLTRFNNHVNKSRQSEENMIARWGEELGRKKWQDTVAKKNTVALVRASGGEVAVDAMHAKRKAAIDKYWSNLSETERQYHITTRAAKSSATKKERYGNKTKLQIYIDKHGELGHELYARYLQKIFKSIGHSKEAEILIDRVLLENPWLLNYSLYYRSSSDKSKCEWFLSSKSGVNFYDFCVREAKSILEYDGFRWHPTKQQAEEFPDELMEITGMTYAQKYSKDQAKIQMAEDRGYKVFVVRSDFTEQQTVEVLSEFINYTTERLQ